MTKIAGYGSTPNCHGSLTMTVTKKYGTFDPSRPALGKVELRLLRRQTRSRVLTHPRHRLLSLQVSSYQVFKAAGNHAVPLWC
jgi:hypothetical protein